MSEIPLVSVVTPCYNGEKFIEKYFDSILSQTYPNIELIFVNNGSVDDSESMFYTYVSKLEKKGIKYIYQKVFPNVGVAGAINIGFANVHGKYITFPDIDDWMTPECIEKKVDYLESHEDTGLVVCEATIIDEVTGKEAGKIARIKTNNNWVFEDIINNRDSFLFGVLLMIRTKYFIETHPNMFI